MHSYLMVAIQLGVLLALVGIIWQCLQMVFGTMEQRKFLVGTVTKWFLFLFCLTFYPAVSRGLRVFAVEMGQYVSGASIKEITDEFGAYLDTLEKALNTEQGNLQNTIDNLTSKVSESSFDERGNQAGALRTSYLGSLGDDYYLMETELYSAQKKKQEIDSIIASIDTDNPKGAAKTINALRSVLIIDDTDITKKYKLDLAMKDASGNDTGFLSPNAMLRMSVLGAQIMWENTWQRDIVKKWDENAEDNKFLKKNIMDFPFDRIFDLILCFLCEILEVVITCIELIQYVMCIIEFVICITFGIVLIPCLLFDGLKDMAMKLIPSLLAQTVKLSMITICMFFCCYTFLDITKTIIADTNFFNIWMFCYVVFTILLTFALCSNAPKLASALLTGQPQMSMGEFVQTAGAIAGGAVAAVGASRAAVGAGSRFAANRLGDVAAMAGGAVGGAENAQSHAKSLGGKATLGALGGVGGALGALGKRTGNRIAGGLQNAANYKGKKGGGGGGSSGAYGQGGNQFDLNEHGKLGRTPSRHTMNYSGHQNDKGNQSTVWGYMADQFKDAKNGNTIPKKEASASVHPDSPGKNNFNPPSVAGNAGGGNGGDSPTPPMPPAPMGQRSPIFNRGSSVSYRPAIEDRSDAWVNSLKSAGSSSV